jgi:hypothetical protein
MGRLFAILSFFVIALFAATSVQAQCLTNADTNCDQSVSVNELVSHINAWYACSSCVPDIFNALQAYFNIPFCGDHSCNATIGEDCSSCQADCGTCGGPQAPPFPQDYIAYWRFENNSNDETGNSNGIEVGNVTYVPGQVGYAFESDEDGTDYINLGSNVGYEGASGITVSFWAKHTTGSSGNEDIISDYSGGDVNVFEVNYGGNELISCKVFDNSGTSVYADMDALMRNTNWHHYVCVYNQTQAYMFFDGTRQAITPAAAGNLQSTSSILRIGSGDSGGWNGLIDEVIIYDRALNDTEVLQIYNNQSDLAPVCTDDPGCTAAGSFCDAGTNTPYDCFVNPNDGCLDRTANASCSATELCQNGQCVPDTCSIISNCGDYLDPTNCSINNCSMNPGFGCAWNTGSNACEDVPDPCAPYTLCSHYLIEANCTNNICGAGVTGCSWNSGPGVCEDAVLPPNAIYVDSQLASDCIGSYSVGSRSCGGGTETAYKRPQAAAGASAPGDTVYFRAGRYYEESTTQARVPVMKITASGTYNNPITFKSYSNEVVILDAFNPSNGARKYRAIEMGVDGSIDGIQNIVIDGLIVEGASYSGMRIFSPIDANNPIPNPSANITIRNVIARYNKGGNGNGRGIYNTGKIFDLLVENCEFYNNTGTGLYVGGPGKTWGGHAIEPEDDMSGPHDCVVRNNLAYDNNHPQYPGNTDGIAGSFTYHCTFENNVVFGNSDDNMDIYGSIESAVRNNILLFSGKLGGNGVGLKFSAGGGGRHNITGNVVLHSTSYSFEYSGPSNPVKNYYPSRIFNNLAYNGHTGYSSGQTMNLSYPGYDKVRLNNNIALDHSNHDMFYNIDTWTDSDYNLISMLTDFNTMQGYGLDANSLTGDAGLVNKNAVIDTNFQPGWTLQQKLDHIRSQVNASFGLSSNSQLRDAGTVIPGYHCTESDDLGSGLSQTNCRHWRGTAPDIGPYEY